MAAEFGATKVLLLRSCLPTSQPFYLTSYFELAIGFARHRFMPNAIMTYLPSYLFLSSV